MAAPAMQVISLPPASPPAPATPTPIQLRPSGPAAITLPPPPPFSLSAPAPAGILPPPRPGGFDFSIHRDAPAAIDQLFPSPAERQKRWQLEQQRENDIANEKAPPVGDSDCTVTTPSSRDLTAPSNTGAGFANIPETACTPHMTLRALKRRNDLYAPK